MARLDDAVVIPVSEPFATVNAALLELLRGFTPDDWGKPTVNRDRDVKDIVAHLLHGSFRRVTAIRDGYRPPSPPIKDLGEIISFVQDDNREFMTGMRRISPAILIELIADYDSRVLDLFRQMDPEAEGLGVAWAGHQRSPNWFDIAREYTEKWHHQQQLRDATGRAALYEPELFAPVLETFARGFPFAYRSLRPQYETSIAVSITGPVALGWTIRTVDGSWSLWEGASREAQTFITIPGDVAWQLWTKGLSGPEASAFMHVDGDPTHAAPLLDFVATLA